MNINQMAVGIVWLGFAIFTVVVFLHDGKAAFALPFDSLTNIASMIDLFIELSLVSIWMHFDARKRGTSAIPLIVVSAVFGCLGRLAYLFFRFGDPRAEPIFRLSRAGA